MRVTLLCVIWYSVALLYVFWWSACRLTARGLVQSVCHHDVLPLVEYACHLALRGLIERRFSCAWSDKSDHHLAMRGLVGCHLPAHGLVECSSLRVE